MTGIDKSFVRKSFNASADVYDRHAGLQHEMGLRLVALAGALPGQGARVLDIGMGTGNLTGQLHAAHPGARIHGCDIAFNMIARARVKLAPQPSRFVAADAEQLPYKSAVFDLVASNFTYQWFERWDGALGEVLRVLRPGGLFVFSAFGSGTFCELRQAFTQACRETGYDRGEALLLPLTVDRMRADMSAAGFASITVTCCSTTVTYPSVNELVRAIKGMGARNASTHRNRSAGVRRVWRRMVDIYERGFKTAAGVPATFEIIMGSGRAG